MLNQYAFLCVSLYEMLILCLNFTSNLIQIRSKIDNNFLHDHRASFIGSHIDIRITTLNRWLSKIIVIIFWIIDILIAEHNGAVFDICVICWNQ